ncbi:capsule assembly Wzi family protein [Mucilaginibacter sp.]|uniref:capsule assembly Wzi family protein n=1 Tax=Mucilaginibacter sp. TaxID=1882438 RepID=UPI00284D23DA|nr:capsule assembly Wzi family protein [Mucilaginibacter sp.]MDR3694915.1 capsule assembly Wzi family protein [Mucilaginibacter sp.]
MKYLSLLILTLFTSIKSFSQTIPVGNSYTEQIARMHQLLGVSDISSSFCIRPLNVSQDSSVEGLIAGKNILHQSVGFTAQLLPFNWVNEYNFNRPYGYNNSSLYPAAGFQSRISAGLFIKSGILRIQLKPEFVYAQNKPFQTFAEVQANNNSSALLGSYFGIVNGIDAPERFGNRALRHLYPGQSKITIILKNIEAGISTENMWWGPGIQNSIMMSNSAPGFLHWTFNSAGPIKTAVGSFEWQIIGGNLNQSGYLPLDTGKLVYGKGMYSPKPKVTRYISAFTASWQPKWIEGLFIGGSAYDYLNKDSSYNAHNIIRKLIPVITGSSVAANAITNTSTGDGQDFAYALNIRQVLSKYNAEIYFEWARNDRAGNLNDFLQEPEHSSAYTVGGTRIFELTKKQFFQIRLELTHLQSAATFLLRQEPEWYVHSVAPRDGYTNDGRYIGAGIGPGSNSLMFDFSLLNGMNSYGMTIERLVHDNDLYYYAFMGTGIFNRQWVDISDTFYANFKFKKYLVSAELTPIYSLNYEYAGGASYNLHASINLTYYFD